MPSVLVGSARTLRRTALLQFDKVYVLNLLNDRESKLLLFCRVLEAYLRQNFCAKSEILGICEVKLQAVLCSRFFVEP